MSNRATISRDEMIHVRLPLADYRRLVAGESLLSQVIAAVKRMLDDVLAG